MQKTERLVVIGGDAAGMSAASQARRLRADLEIVAFERGAYTSYSACGMPYYVGGVVADVEPLIARRPEEFLTRGIRAHVRHEVESIDVQQAVERDQPANAVIVGGGKIGLEMAAALVMRGLKVSLVERASAVMNTLDRDMGEMVSQVLRDVGVTLYLEESVEDFETNARSRDSRANGPSHISGRSGDPGHRHAAQLCTRPKCWHPARADRSHQDKRSDAGRGGRNLGGR